MGLLGHERRGNGPRIPIHILVDFKSTDLVMMEYAQNISTQGIFIETRDILPIGSTVLVSFILPDAPRLITVQGAVVRAKRKSHRKVSSTSAGMGIRFAEINPEDERAISEFITKWEAGRLPLEHSESGLGGGAQLPSLSCDSGPEESGVNETEEP